LNLELRKAALEASGQWPALHVVPDRDRCSNCDAAYQDISEFCTVGPAVESDPGVSEPWIDEFCKRGPKQMYWTVRRSLNNEYCCSIVGCGGTLAKQYDQSPSAARAKAVIEAARKERP